MSRATDDQFWRLGPADLGAFLRAPGVALVYSNIKGESPISYVVQRLRADHLRIRVGVVTPPHPPEGLAHAQQLPRRRALPPRSQ
ncbi:MAG: hypothetical protein IPK80_28810 [Nannocystis sp.]|nr:hypothetical protein [Nannocystis sp.]